jgi:hypothetical protein
VNAHFAADAAFQIDLAEALQVVEAIELLNLNNAIDRSNFQARLASGAIVGM